MFYYRSFPIPAVLYAIACLLGSHVMAQTWTGNTSALWSNGANWTGGAPVSSGSSALTFNPASLTGSAITSTSNDLTDFTATSITFNNSTTAGAFTLAGNQIILGGNITTTGTTGTPTHTISLSLILNGTRTIAAITDNNITVSGLISETGGSQGLIKANAGVLTLSNAGNSFTGTMAINQGTVSVNSLAASGVPSAIGAGNAISLGSSTTIGGTLTYTGSSSVTVDRSITLGATTTGGGTINNNGSGALVFSGTFANSQTSGAKTFTLGGSNTGANDFQSNIVNGSGGTLGVTKANAGTWTLSGNNTYTGTTIIQQGTLNAAIIADTGSSNLGLGTTMRIGGATTTGTLNYTGTGNSTARTLQIGNNSATPVAGDTGGAIINQNGPDGGTGLKFTAANFNTTGLTGSIATSRTLTLGGSNTDANEISGVIADGLSGTMATALTKSGNGRWILAGANTYTGPTTVSGGVLQLNHATALPGGIGTTGGISALILNGGVLGLGSGDFTRSLGTGASQVQLTANLSGFAAFGADRIVNLGGASAAVTWASGSFMTAGSSLVLSHATATHTLDFQNPIVLSGTRFFNVPDGAAAVDARLSGAITGSTSFSKTGAGTLELTNTGNAWTGLTYIDSGTLRLGASNVLPNNSVELKRATTADTHPVLDLNGFSDTIGGINLGHGTTTAANAGGQQSIINSGGAATLTLGGNIEYRSGSAGFENGQALISANIDTGGVTRNITVGDGLAEDDLVISGVISGAGTLFKLGTGTLVLSGANIHTGQMNLQTGTLKLGASGVLPDANTVQMGTNNSTSGTTLDLNGFSETIGALSLGGAGGTNSPAAAGNIHTIVNTGAAGAVLTLGGPLNYYNGNTNPNGRAEISASINSGAAARNFIVEDSSHASAATVDLLISGTIVGTNGFNKAGAGTLALSAANTFSGVTRPGAGVLLLQNNLALQNSPLNLETASAGTISLDSGVTTPTFGGLRGERNLTSVITSGYGSVTQITLNPGTGSTNNYSGVIPDGATGMNLVKTGVGTQILAGANTYTGTTTVNGGLLQVGNAGTGTTGTGAVTVNSSSTILGTGIIRGSSFTAASGSTVHAGDGTGASNYGTLTFTSATGTGTYDFQAGSSTFLGLDLSSPSNSDKLLFTNNGSLTFNGNLTVGPASFTPSSTAVFQLLDWMALGSTTFHSRYTYTGLLFGNGDEAPGFDLPDISSGGIYAWDISLFASQGSIAIVVVPEPSRVFLILFAATLITLRRRRDFKSQHAPRRPTL